MALELREARPGDLGGPVLNGFELREAAGGVQIKDMDEGKREVLVEFPHDTIDSFKTMFTRGAFEDSFKQRLPVMCWQHNLKEPIGHATRAQVLDKSNEIVGAFDDFDAVPLARRAYSQIESGTLTDFSFGFKGATFRPTGQRGVRAITHAFMGEFSPVTIGSIPGAKVTGLREDGMDIDVLSIEQVMEFRESGLFTVESAATYLREHYPSLAEHIIITTPSSGTRGETGTADGSGDDTDTNANLAWTATDAGLHTATGPNGEHMTVHKSGDKHVWSVVSNEGDSMGSGREDSHDDAKSKAEGAVSGKREVWDGDSPVTADLIREALGVHEPGMFDALRGSSLLLRAADDVVPTGMEGGGSSSEYAAAFASAVDAALDAALQQLEGVDVASLPDEVQQMLALVQAASVAADELLDAMGIDDPDEHGEDQGTRADSAPDGWDTGDWDFDESDYSPEQYKSAALIDTGEGDENSKDRYALPVKTPEGKTSVKGVAAAASRINQVQAPTEEKRKAAKKLMGLYSELKRPVPANVLKVAGKGSGDGERGDEEITAPGDGDVNVAEQLAAMRNDGESKLDAILSRKS